MIALVRSWLMGVMGVAVVTAMAEGLMPEGAVKQVGKLTAGLVLLVAALTPILSLDLEEILPVSQWEGEQSQSIETLETLRKNQWEALIVADLETYIVDKAQAWGMDCHVAVTCRQEEEIYLPDTVVIRGTFTEEEVAQLTQMVVVDFGISEDKIQWIEEGTE